MDTLKHSPNFDCESALQVAQEIYGLQVSALPLPSERDQNFLLTDIGGERFVLKLANALEQRELLEAQNAVLSHVAGRISFCPRVIPTTSGELIATVKNHYVRLVDYLPGTPLAEVKPQTPELLQNFGEKLGQLTLALADFDHPAFHRDFHWDLANGPRVIAEFAPLIRDDRVRQQVLSCTAEFDHSTLNKLPKSVIHGDANDYNVLVDPEVLTVTGLIDLGDMVQSYTVGDLAIAIAYVVLDKTNPIAAAANVIAGYRRQRVLSDLELAVLWDLVLMRLCMSVCMAAVQQQTQPENEYLSISQRSIRNSLPRLLAIDARVATDQLRHVTS